MLYICINKQTQKDMRPINVNNDISNPEKYNAMINNRNIWVEPKIIDKGYDSTMEGVIHTTVNGFNIIFQSGKYFIEDRYGNSRYISNFKNKCKVFEFYAQSKIQFIDDINIMDIEIMFFFKRTKSNAFKSLWKQYNHMFNI